MKNTSALAILFALTASQFSFAQDHHRAMTFDAPARKTAKVSQAKDTLQTPPAEVASAVPAELRLRSNSLVDDQKEALLRDHKIIYIDGRPENPDSKQHQDSIRDLVENFFYDQFQSFSDPAAPYFLFMGKNAELAMGIGGCVRIRGWYDFDAAIPANSFTPYLIPMVKDPANNSKLGATPAGSTLFFRVIGKNKTFGNYQLYIEANFNGYGGTDFHLKKAYAQLNNVTLGYASSTFSDPAALPPTVDANGPANKISPTSVLVRWMNTYKQRWTVAGSAELPKNAAVSTVAGKIGTASQTLPDFAAFIQYAWGKSEHVRLAGLARSLPYEDILSHERHHKFGWGMQLSTVVHPISPVTLYGTFNCGEGHESTTGDLQVGNYDLVPSPHNPMDMYAPFSLGWCVGAQYNFLPNLFASVSYSDSRYFPRSPREASEYRYGNIFTANVFWNLTPRIQAGLEFDTGVRKNWSGNSRRADRLGVMAQFSF
ncbi:MAG: hypothetical protein K2L45_00460 [Muribaculaceae bacterium]|nr:hypothetical protein [Muribaculaceae bacterium]